MGKLQLSRLNTLIMITATVAICIISLAFAYIYNSHKVTSEQTIDSYKTTVRELEQEFTREKNARINAETELFKLQSMDWQTKYEHALSENTLLTENIAAKEQYDEIDLARLNRALDFLSAQNYSIKDSLFSMGEILVQYEEKSLSDYEKWQENNHLLNEQLKYTELQKNDLQDKIEKLESKIKHHNNIAKSDDKGKDSVKPELIITDTPDTQKIPGENNKSDVYRHVRLQSLHNAMLNQDSGTRSKILISVIPSIPNGISGSELLALLVNMNSTDVITVIKAVNKYILRPLDSQTIHTMTANMNQNDAEAAALLLLKEQ